MEISPKKIVGAGVVAAVLLVLGLAAKNEITELEFNNSRNQAAENCMQGQHGDWNDFNAELDIYNQQIRDDATPVVKDNFVVRSGKDDSVKEFCKSFKR